MNTEVLVSMDGTMLSESRPFLGKICMFCISAIIVFMGSAFAVDYPTKPIRLIVPAPPGGSSDILSRLIGPKMTESMGQQVVIDYRAGAGGVVGTAYVAKSIPDGYTLLVVSASHTILQSLQSQVPYDTIKDFAPVIRLGSVPYLLVLHPSIPANSVQELIALAKSKPGVLTFGSAGIGSGNHLAGELFKNMTGIDMLHVPFKGAGQSTIDLLGGHISLAFSNPLPNLPYIQSGKLKALAVTSSKRHPIFPDIPTVAESGVPGFEATAWYGVLAPAKTPREIVKKLNTEIKNALLSQSVHNHLTKQGITFNSNLPEEFNSFIEADVARWSKVTKAAGIQPR